MKRQTILTLVLCLVSVLGCIPAANEPDTTCPSCQPPNALDSLLTPISTIESLFADKDSNVTVTVKATITAILSDDTVGDRHQRFIIRLSNGQTLLVAHNIDIGARVVGISTGSVVYVHGDYIWNSQGGLVHWTHRDPDAIHENGWIIFAGVTYD